MRLILNVLWLVLAGFWLFLGYVAAGVVWCITIIGIPFGIASFRIGFFALWPFGRTVVKKPTAGVGSAIGNVIWFIFSGLWLAIGHAVTGVLLCVTIIGIPLGLANFKLIPVSLLPLGRDIVPVDDLNAAWVQASVPPTPPGPPAVRG
ncbi:MAG: YccF domain-containing protein [Nocardioidaceae bacterium]